MQFSERWLRTLVDPPLSTAALAEKLTMGGLEVEELKPVAPPFSGVVVGEIRSITSHPHADRLRVCNVDAGSGSTLSIVCGAPNAAVGMKAPCALPGALLPGGLAIKTTTMRGVESQGMLCSAKELGIADDASGLLALPADAQVGTDVRDALALDDTRLTLKLTPNRADCLSLVGIAREVSALTGTPLVPPPVTTLVDASTKRRRVRVDEPAACPRFASRTIEGIDPTAATPAWMKERIERSGIRSISAVVDITNYVMLEQGQPLHAYDDKLLDGDIVVRFAREGEKLTLLNGQVLDLTPDLLMVCDEKKPLGLAGIMGGEHSGISDATNTVYLEGAFWSPAVVQGKMRRLGFISDAGYRFERGVDFGGCARGVDRAAELIVAICGGRSGPLDDVIGPLPARDPVRLRTSRVARLLGIDVPAATIADLFGRLGLAFERTADGFVVTPPSYRFDLAIEEDLVEEIARLNGFDAIPATPSAHVQRMLADPEGKRSVNAVKRQLGHRDWQEVVTFTFVDSAWEHALFPERPASEAPIKVQNPIASQHDVMRTTLAGGLIGVLVGNLSRRADRVRIFETGRCFLRTKDGCEQPLRLGGLAYGDAFPEQWGARPPRAVDYFDVKGDIEALVAPRALTTERDAHPALHPGRAARVLIDGAPAGWLGELHPRLARHFDLPRAPVLFELELAPLQDTVMPHAKAISRLPLVRRDLAIVIADDVPAQQVLAALEAAAVPRVESIRLFDAYRGPGLGDGKKSLAILVLIRDTERTLTDPEIDAATAKLLEVVADRFSATLRR